MQVMECADTTYVPGYRIWQHEVEWRDRADQLFGAGDRRGAGAQQLADGGIDGGVEVIGWNRAMDQADAVRLAAVKPLACQEQRER